MSMNTPEDEPRTEEESAGNPLDGRDGQPVEGGSSDDPRTLRSQDPLEGERRAAEVPEGHAARGAQALPVGEEGRARTQEDLENAAGARVQEPTDAAGQEAGGLDALGRPLPEDYPEGEGI